MKRFVIGICLALLLPLTATIARADTYTEGQQYALIPAPQPTTAPPGKVEVVELFWYGCPHCYAFEPYLKEWLKHKPANAYFVRIPAIFNSPLWRLQATAYYTAEVLGILDKIHEPLFDAIHKYNIPLNTEDQLADFFAKYGVDKKQFHDTFNSFAVQAKVNRAAELTRLYGISGVPSIVVAGKYRTDGPMAKSYETLLNVVNYLVAKEAHAQAGGQKAGGAAIGN